MEVQDGRIQNEEELHKKLYRLRKLKEEQERADAQRRKLIGVVQRLRMLKR